MAVYKMVQIPRDISIAAKGMFKGAPDPSQIAAQYLENVVSTMSQQGWEFQRVDSIGVTTSPGCILSLFGVKSSDYVYYVMTFRK